MLRALLSIAALSAALAAAPAFAQNSGQTTVQPAANPDPWERTNRRLYAFDRGLDRAIIRPTTVFYHHALTHQVREGVHNVIYNLGEPVTFLNNLLQGDPDKAAATVVRFATNSTVGVLGVFDVTSMGGMQRDPTGFSATLNRYGVGHGPYIYLPVFGPSSVRDLTGRVVDVLTDPFNWANYDGSTAASIGRTAAAGIDRRDDLDPDIKEVDRSATDPYATTRAAFLQVTAATGEAERDAKALPDFGPETPPTKADDKTGAKPKPHDD